MRNNNIIIKIINILTVVIFVFNNITVSALVNKPVSSDTLNATLRTKPITVVSWDKAAKDYIFNDSGSEILRKRFMNDASMAYLSIALRYFLLYKKQDEEKFNSSSDHINYRFGKFRERLEQYKSNSSLDFSGFIIDDAREELGMRLEKETVWIPKVDKDNKLYMFGFYLSSHPEKIPKKYMEFSDEASSISIICDKLGPFDPELYDRKDIAVATRPDRIYEILNYSIFDMGSELNIEWGKDINARCYSEIFKALSKTKLSGNKKYNNSDLMERTKFISVIINNIISTCDISDPVLRKAFCNIALMDVSDPEEKKELQKQFVAAWYQYFRVKYEKKDLFMHISTISDILSEIEKEFKRANIDTEILDDFRSRMDGFVREEFDGIIVEEDESKTEEEKEVPEQPSKTEEDENNTEENIKNAKDLLKILRVGVNRLLEEINHSKRRKTNKITEVQKQIFKRFGVDIEKQAADMLGDIEQKINNIFLECLDIKHDGIEELIGEYETIMNQPKLYVRTSAGRSFDEIWYYYETFMTAGYIMYSMSKAEKAKKLLEKTLSKLEISISALKINPSFSKDDIDLLNLKMAKTYVLLARIETVRKNIPLVMENAKEALALYEKYLRENGYKSKSFLMEIAEALHVLRYSYIAFGAWDEIDRCNELYEKITFIGNESAEEHEKNVFINQQRMFMDLMLRSRKGSTNRDFDDRFMRYYKRSRFYDTENDYGSEVLLAWKYFQQSEYDTAAEVLEKMKIEGAFINEEKEIYLRLCGALFLHFYNMGNKEKAVVLKDKFFDVYEDEKTDRGKAVSQVFSVLNTGYGVRNYEINDVSDQYASVESITLILLMDLIFKQIGINADLNDLFGDNTESPETKKILQIIEHIFYHDVQYVETEILWRPVKNVDRVTELLEKCLEIDSEHLSLYAQYNIVRLLTELKPDKFKYYKKMENISGKTGQELYDMIKKFLPENMRDKIRTDNLREYVAIYVREHPDSKGTISSENLLNDIGILKEISVFLRRVKKKNFNYKIYLRGLDLIADIEHRLVELKSEFSAPERVKLIKENIVDGAFYMAMEKIEEAKDEAIRADDGKSFDEIELIGEMLKLTGEANDGYEKHDFMNSWINISTVRGLFQELDIVPGGQFETFSEKCRIMSGAQEAYESEQFDKAIEIAEEIEDDISVDFINKVRFIENFDAKAEKNFSKIEKMHNSYPEDTLVGVLYLECRKNQKIKENADKVVRDKIREMKNRINNVSLKDREVLYKDFTDEVRKIVLSMKYFPQIENLIAWVVRKMKKDECFSDALAFMDSLIKPGSANRLKKHIDMLKKEIINSREEKIKKQKRSKIEDFLKEVKEMLEKDMISEKETDKIIKILSDKIPQNHPEVPVIVKQCALKLFDIREYGRLRYFVIKILPLIKGHPRERDIVMKLSKKASLFMSVNNIKRHFDILDCQVKAENLITKRYERSFREKTGKSAPRTNLERFFDSIEKVDQVDPETGQITKKIRISKIYLRTDKEKDKKKYIDDLHGFTLFQKGETFSLNCDLPGGGKVQMFVEPAEIKNDHVYFDIVNQDETDQLSLLQEGMSGVMAKINDSSLFKRRNLLRIIINNLTVSLRDRKGEFSTGHKLIDVLLGVCKGTKYRPSEKKIIFKDKFLENDKWQNKAVREGLDRNMPVSMIQGPPGTGKTRVTVELIRQFYDQGKKVLVVSQSNPGVDNIAKRLIALQNDGEDIRFARVGGDDAEISEDEEIQKIWKDSKDILAGMYSSKKGKVVLGTTNGFYSAVSSVNGEKEKEFYAGDYDVVIIEEAGRATMAETLMPASAVKNDGTGKAVLVGDHIQLPAYGIDHKTIQFIKEQLVQEKTRPGKREEEMKRISRIMGSNRIKQYKTSLFEDMWDSPMKDKGVTKTLLRKNRRSLWPIAKLVSEIFYDSEMTYGKKDFSMVSDDTLELIDYTEESFNFDRGFDRSTQNGSKINLTEAEIAVSEFFKKINLKKEDKFLYGPENVNIVTSYKGQIKLINIILRAIAIINDLQDDIETFPEDIVERIEGLSLFAKYRSEYDHNMNYQTLNSITSKMYKNYLDKEFRNDAYEKLLDIFNLEFIKNYELRGMRYKRDLSGAIDFFGCGQRIVRTIDSMQGSENDVIILSLVRSNPSKDIGFLGDYEGMRRLNVAISRARKKLTIIGDFTNTLTQADHKRVVNPERQRDIIKSREAFKKMVAIVGQYRKEYKNYAVDRWKDLGGKKTDNRKDINPYLEELIKAGKIVKVKLGQKALFYKPRYVAQYSSSFDDMENTVNPVFTYAQMTELKNVIRKYASSGHKYLDISKITIGIIKDSYFVKNGAKDNFSIVHTGERTKTIYFGELFLRYLLDSKDKTDLDKIIEHEIKHILEPENAVNDHESFEYKQIVKVIDSKCELSEGESQAKKMLDLIKFSAYKVSKNDQKLIIGIDTDWLPYKEGIQPLIDKGLEELSGKYNIVFIKERGAGLAGKLKSVSTGTDFSNMIILGSNKTFKNNAFDEFKNTDENKKAWFFEVDPYDIINSATGIDEENYIRMIEMLRAALIIRLKDYKDLNDLRITFPGLIISAATAPRYFIVMPLAKPYDHENLTKIYKAELAIILSA